LPETENIVELIDIEIPSRSGRKLFDRLNFSLPAGRTAVIIGQTGAGKTTLAELIIGVSAPESGTVLVFGHAVKPGQIPKLTKLRRKIGGVGGVYDLVSHQTVYENLLNPLIFRGETVKQQKRKIEKCLTEFDLTLKRNEIAGNLSRGEIVMVMLARAVIADQPLLLIDEPLAGLDKTMVNSVMKILKKLATSGHSLIILTTGAYQFDINGKEEYYLTDGRLV
jgi:putative spermidine/putrescine transport system ATP-binding protein